MHKKRFNNHSEYRTLKVLDRSLESSPFRVHCKVRLSDAIDFDKGEVREYVERNFLMTAHLDFLVINQINSEPQFAVEFDGPQHTNDPAQRRRDTTKNRLCDRAKLPLLRIGDAELEEYDQTTLLDYILERFVAWQSEHQGIEGEISDYVASLSKEEISGLTEGGIADPSIDSTFIFDCRHRFPGTIRTACSLYTDFGIISIHLDSNLLQDAQAKKRDLYCWGGIAESNLGDEHCVALQFGYGVFRKPADESRLTWVHGKLTTPGIPILHEGQIKFRMRWTLPVVENYNPREAPIDYFLRTGKMPIAFPNLPGVHIPDVAEQFGEYLCLRRVELWAKSNLAGL